MVETCHEACGHGMESEIEVYDAVAAVLVLQPHGVCVVVFRIGAAVDPCQRTAVVVHVGCVADIKYGEVQVYNAVACNSRCS